MKVLKIFKIFISLFLMIGALVPILHFAVFNEERNFWYAPIAILSAFMGTGLMFGFSGFRTEPKNIGNFDDSRPQINQTWMVFYITLVFNLLFANFC